MQLSIIGSGHVGLITGVAFAYKGHKVLCVDNDINKIEKLKKCIAPIYEPLLQDYLERNAREGRIFFSTSIKEAVDFGTVIFITVGTPPTASGAADLSYIEAVAREIALYLKEYRVIVEKSTVPVETGEKIEKTLRRYVNTSVPFDVVSNPEFLREGSAIEDALNPDRIVIGVKTKRARQIMEELYRDFHCPKIFTNVKSAEIIKHASNSFLAMKISYINAVANICELVGADITEVAQGMGLDKRIGSEFLNAGIGYGGSCFPKDVEAFIKISESLGYDFKLLKAVSEVNLLQRDKFIRKIEEELWILKGKKIAVLGLSFKPKTDDIREAPSIYVINKLLEAGSIVKAYDPKAMENAKEIFKERVQFCNDLYEACKDSDLIAILTEWDEFKEMDLDKVKSLVKTPIIVDGRNIFNPEFVRNKGFIYRSFGRI